MKPIAIACLAVLLALLAGCTVAEPANPGWMTSDPTCITVVKSTCTGDRCYVEATNGNVYRIHPVRAGDFVKGQKHFVKVEMYDLTDYGECPY